MEGLSPDATASIEKRLRMRTGNVKQISVTQEMIDSMVPGCCVNNSVTVALKEQSYPHAKEIVVNGDEIYIDKVLIHPVHSTVKFIKDWHAGRRVKPCILGFREW
jgi:hypothetical protein